MAGTIYLVTNKLNGKATSNETRMKLSEAAKRQWAKVRESNEVK